MSAWQPKEKRQLTIERRLELVGAGPAIYFGDACQLMEGNLDLDTRSHLVGHLIREVQSAVMAVLRPMVEDGNWPPKGTRNSRTFQIAAVCDALRVPAEDELRSSWDAFAGALDRLAHRDGLRRPRPVDEDFDLFWDRAQAVLFAVSGRIEATYAEALPRIEELAAGEPEVKAFRQTMLHSTVALDRFFELAGVQWLEPLRADGWFRDPPALVPNDDGGYAFPRWPQGRFLARVAIEAPETVVEIGRTLHTDNPEAHQSLVDAACSLQVSEAVPLVEPICEWLQTPVQWALPFKVRDLIVHLYGGGAEEEGLELTRALLTSPEIVRGDDVAGEHLKWLVPKMFPAAGIAGLEMIVSLLKRQLGDGSDDSLSYIWRPNIEVERRRDDRDQIVSAVRDAARTLAERDTSIDRIVAVLEVAGMQTGERLALDLLSRHPTSDLARDRLMDRSTLEKFSTRREYLALVAAGFDGLKSRDQDELLRWAEEGPAEEEDPRRIRFWQLQFLNAVGDNLPARWESTRADLMREIGPLDPDAPRIVTGYHGDLSPVDAEELQKMDEAALVDYLAGWAAEDGVWTPSKAGLARTLEESVFSDPRRYAGAARLLEGLEPIYTSAVFGALRKAVEDGKRFEWGPVLELVESDSRRPQPEARDRRDRDRDSDHARSWWDSSDLIFHGLFRSEAEIGYGLREQTRHILTLHFDRVDPTIAMTGDQEGGDPSTLALNSVRCRTLQAICRLAVRDREEGEDGLRTDVVDLLERALDPDAEPSPALRWTLGRCFGDLVFADEEWARGRVDRLFPLDDERQLWRAAWEGYVSAAPPAPLLLELLEGQYRRAIEELSAAHDDGKLNDPDGALVTNLMSHYLSGTISLEEPDGLLELFYARAPTERRALAISAIGTGLDSASSPPPEAVVRMEALADRRLRAVQDGAPPEELSGIAWWIDSGEFELEWSLEYLRALLEAGGIAEPDHMVAEWLSKMSAVKPLAAIEILRLMLEGAVRDWFVMGARDSIETILLHGLAEGGAAGSVARDLVNVIVAQGATDFARLLDGPTGL